MSRLAIPAERAAELISAFRDRSRLVDDADGFVDLRVWQSDRDAGEVLMDHRDIAPGGSRVALLARRVHHAPIVCHRI